ncbi:hypothetical protein GCM10022221_22230 [Actinocorallia aurea]
MPTPQLPFGRSESSQRSMSSLETTEAMQEFAERWTELVHPHHPDGDRPSQWRAREAFYREKMRVLIDAAKARIEQEWPGLFEHRDEREAWVKALVLRVAVEHGLPEAARTRLPAPPYRPTAVSEPTEEVEQIMALLRPLTPRAIGDVLGHVTRRLHEEDLRMSW